jgi:hypothetical protein
LLEKGKDLFRAWFAKVWKVRGGGLYAVGWAVTFAYLEITTIVGEILEADGIVDFFTSQLMEFFLRFMSDSVLNMIQAFMWPVEIVQWQPPVGAIALGAAFVIFPTYVKPHITAWLFPDGEPDDGESEPGDTQRK